jgi:hypothetical protein
MCDKILIYNDGNLMFFFFSSVKFASGNIFTGRCIEKTKEEKEEEEERQ